MSGNDPQTIAALWQQAVTAGRTAPAYLVDEGERWREVAWAEARSRVDELAHALLDLGMKKGDGLALVCSFIGRPNISSCFASPYSAGVKIESHK